MTMAQHAGVGLAARTADTALLVQSIKILLVEDSAMLAQRLMEGIAPLPQFEVIGIADTESEALQIIRRRRVDIVLLDLQLKAGTGFGVLRGLATMHRKPLVVVLTNHDLPEYHAAALELGVTEFLDKARAFHRLPAVLREMLHNFRVD
jgi:DNA-binding NarL/FixJ family response regulator